MQVQDGRKLPRGAARRSAVGGNGAGEEADDGGAPERKGKMD